MVSTYSYKRVSTYSYEVDLNSYEVDLNLYEVDLNMNIAQHPSSCTSTCTLVEVEVEVV